MDRLSQTGLAARTLILAGALVAALALGSWWILSMDPKQPTAHGHHAGHEDHDDHDGHESHESHEDHEGHGEDSDHDDHDGHGGHGGHGDADSHGAEGDPDLSEQADDAERMPRRWHRVRVSDASLQEAGVVWEPVEERALAVRLPLVGRIVLNADRVAHVHPRFPGLIRSVSKTLGEKVARGEELVVIESNESLQRYAVTSQIAGTVIAKHATLGESAPEGKELFVIADLSTVWVDFQVFRQDFSKLRVGQRVRVSSETDTAETRIAYLAPVGDEHSQTLTARAVLDNRDGRWAPGLFVSGEAAVDTFTAAALPMAAVQTLDGSPVAFVREASGEAGVWVAHPLELGRRDGPWVELVRGPPVGAEAVVRRSYWLKAESGKGEAGHEH